LAQLTTIESGPELLSLRRTRRLTTQIETEESPVTSAHRQAEEARPELGPPVLEVVGGALHDCRQEVAVAVLVLAPFLELLEDGVQLLVRVVLEIAVDGDVAPVANLLREVRRVQDVLGLEEGVLAVLG
jgi:hypothetical protein